MPFKLRLEMSLVLVSPVAPAKSSTAPLTGTELPDQFPATLQLNGEPALPLQMLVGPVMFT